ncbi:cysteine desulfurase family protein [Taklimakanibacter lacteus]|uniref:cysteine desulfurase family protein n=1 Tax=Taklimakanibacter lacteus TaxID=2268456 RepID=UPI000E66B1D4
MRIYLDHNATSPLRENARKAMLAALELHGNASSIHGEGRRAHALLDEARETVARALGVLAPMVVFTSGGSEANNLALKGVAVERLIVSAIEHPSVLEAAKATGKPVAILPVDARGIVDLEALDRLLGAGPKALVSVMLANNETGVIEPIRDVVALAHRHGALVHSDAVQAVGKMPVNFGLLGVDLLTLSAHKLGGPQGAGALIIRDGLALEPLIHGGGQELRRRAGTENIAAIVGFAAAIAEKGLEIKALRDHLESRLEDAVIFAAEAERLPNTSCFAAPGLSAETALMALDLAGFAVSSGSACSSGKVAKSHVLQAMGVAPDLAGAALRVSLGWTTTADDIEKFISAWAKLKARRKAA